LCLLIVLEVSISGNQDGSNQLDWSFHLGNNSDLAISEPKKILPKITIAGIQSAIPDGEVIDINVKNKEIGDLVRSGHMFTLNFMKDKGNYKCAFIKMSPEIRAVIEKKTTMCM